MSNSLDCVKTGGGTDLGFLYGVQNISKAMIAALFTENTAVRWIFALSRKMMSCCAFFINEMLQIYSTGSSFIPYLTDWYKFVAA